MARVYRSGIFHPVLAAGDWGLQVFEGGIRATIKEAVGMHLTFEPGKESKSRIKRLRGLRQPEYRLRIDQIRVYYDIDETDGLVRVLRILPKAKTSIYLEREGIPHEDDATD